MKKIGLNCYTILLISLVLVFQSSCYLQTSCGGKADHKHKIGIQQKSCCPEGSWPALEADYKVKGQIFDLGDTTVYHTGNSDKVLIIFSDIYGIYSGRHFSVADSYADLGFHVYVPQLLIKPYNKQGNIADTTRSQDYDRMEKRFSDLVDYLNQKGYKQFYGVGFCWGAWMAFKMSTIFDGFKAIAGIHPSLRVSQIYNQTQKDLVSSIKAPAFLYAAGNDPDNVKEGGELVQLLKKRFGEDKAGSFTFSEQIHGWVMRGDLTIPNVLRDVKKAIELSALYFKKF